MTRITTERSSVAVFIHPMPHSSHARAEAKAPTADIGHHPCLPRLFPRQIGLSPFTEEPGSAVAKVHRVVSMTRSRHAMDGDTMVKVPDSCVVIVIAIVILISSSRDEVNLQSPFPSRVHEVEQDDRTVVRRKALEWYERRVVQGHEFGQGTVYRGSE